MRNGLIPAFDRLLEDFAMPTWTHDNIAAAASVDETATDFVLSFDVPGLKREDIQIEVDGRTLRVSGERKETVSDAKRHFSEQRYGRFERAFELGPAADLESISAELDHGVLKLRVAKSEKAKPRSIEIK